MAKFHLKEWTSRAENHRQANSGHRHLGERAESTRGGGPEPAAEPGKPKLDGRGNGGGMGGGMPMAPQAPDGGEGY